MTIDELKEAIDEFRGKGFTDMQISYAFGRMYLDDKCNYKDLEIILPMLNMKINPDFAAMTDEERKEQLRKAFGIKPAKNTDRNVA